MCFFFVCFCMSTGATEKFQSCMDFILHIIMCFVPGSSADSYKTLILLSQLAVNLLRSNLYTVIIQVWINFDFWSTLHLCNVEPM